ncbi:Uma2 family endonuclease [Georgenia phoenicis]|uniref:Uma2 family endonuclease n=1 Tax=unclassified Georgenia TaxID=2626815 RepID=UPI0039B06B55
MTVMPRTGEEWTVDDLDRIPEDGLQYELLDGLLLVTPAPVRVHQRAIGNLHLLLRAACPPGFEVLLAPFDWRPDRRTSLQPDLLVVRDDDPGTKNVTKPLALAVEVLSPSTRRKDHVLKRSKYEEAGVESYWLVDPQEPGILALDLVDGRYVTAAEVVGTDTAHLRLPFAVDVVPSALVAPPG